MTYRAVLSNRDVLCERYATTDHGVELYDQDDTFLAFVPYENLLSLLNEDVHADPDRSII
jgi:hypothetical protein